MRSLTPGNGIELNGKITGLENIRLSKAFEASANQTNSGLTAYNVKAEMEIPELMFEFDLVKVGVVLIELLVSFLPFITFFVQYVPFTSDIFFL